MSISGKNGKEEERVEYNITNEENGKKLKLFKNLN